MDKPRIYTMSFANVYPLYVAKAAKKQRTKAEVDQIIQWLTGYNPQQLQTEVVNQTTLEDFYNHAPHLNPARRLITGMICGVRVEEIQEPIMQEIRYLDKLIDELAHGKSMDKILRRQTSN
jgi:hypothetical protein